MPHDLARLQADIAQVWHKAAGFGTGRLVAKNLILTAAHVLWRNEADREASTGPELEGWQVRLAKDYVPGAPPLWPFRFGNRVVWHDRARDLALIQLVDPEEGPLRPLLQLRIATVEGSNPHSVEARGYPRASKEEDQRELKAAFGRLTGLERHRPLYLGVDSCDLPNDPHAGWPGMSGSAVLLRDGPNPKVIWVYGVVQEVPANFDRQLRVARLADAWQQDAEFRKLLVEAGATDQAPEDPNPPRSSGVVSPHPQPPPFGPARRIPGLPINFIQRQVIADVKAKIETFHTCVLLGPTGMGKTVGAISILKSASADSLWLDGLTFEPSDDLRAANLIILDDLPINHPVLRNRWLRNIASQLVVTTTSTDVAMRILSDRGLANKREAITEFGGFTESESKQFLDQALGDLLSDDEKRAIALRLLGSPIGLQALPDLLLGGRSVASWWWRGMRWLLRILGIKDSKSAAKINAFLPESGRFDVEGVATTIMEQWIEQLRSPDTTRLLRILCRTSTLGMSPDTLASVAYSTTASNVQRRLASAVDKGFIRRAFDRRFPTVELLIPHDVLRNHFLALPRSDQDLQANSRYIACLKEKPVMDPASQVDAVMAGMQNAFLDDTNPDNFAKSFNHFTTILQKTLVEESLPTAQIERVARLFEIKLSPFQVKDCSVIIAIAHSVGFLPPSLLLASMIWAGARCVDSWARGASIRAAVHHWLATGRNDLGEQHLRQWLDVYVSCPERPQYDPISEEEEDNDGSEVDLDLAAAVGGLCALGFPEVALERLDTSWNVRNRKHSPCSIAHHALLVGLSDYNNDALLACGIDRLWEDMPDEPHKRYLQFYLHSKGMQVPQPIPLNVEPSDLAYSIARAAHSLSFRKFILARQPNAKAYI